MSHSPSEIAESWLHTFDERLRSRDINGAAKLFQDHGFWRDFVSFTWNIKTFEGSAEIEAMLDSTLDRVQPSGWTLLEAAEGDEHEVDAWVGFDTAQARGKAHLRLRDGKAWTLLTTMEEIRGHEEHAGSHRDLGVRHEVVKGRRSWLEQKVDREERLGRDEQPYTLIVGGGQNGINLAARLGRLGVPAIVIDKKARPGDNWRSRYKSLHLHDPVWFNHMPYMSYPDSWPVFPSKDKVGDWLEAYTTIMEINYWANTECVKARYDAESDSWSVDVVRDGEHITLRPRQLVIALGVSGYPHIPAFDGAEDFAGAQHHSSQHSGGGDWSGKRAVVIGSNNSAHDIAADLWEHGADVTMLQRSSTMIARSGSLVEYAFAPLYTEDAVKNGISLEKADMLASSIPLRVAPDVQKPIYKKIADHDAEFYAQLREAGFALDFGDDDSGLHMKYLRRGSGYYIDVGASQLIIDGHVKLRQGQVSKITESAIILDDGTEVEADVIVYATGYGSMNAWLADLISPEVADQVGKCWGYGSDTTKDPGPWEGELRNMWKPTNVENLWIHGGNFSQGRQFSKYLALQIKARMEGLDTKVYGLQPSHHTR
ncbi:NAD(P)/FAD-dependent oxidoreductase [Rhodococcus sp. T2V]|uniref:flavin-containing monooxygenase n=1 Tax=Rhodococcus sp. T2V TaxID=3034164 RepID=UPI0023E1C1D9|nr:NAD(P)/FAD-dependent oxidoreductase [Rhodococcus sp. T2V]MDF3311346.1 NAD(P)/FAD-dependent oxidoreductase [Rhodococcus sp. T2V]